MIYLLATDSGKKNVYEALYCCDVWIEAPGEIDTLCKINVFLWKKFTIFYLIGFTLVSDLVKY